MFLHAFWPSICLLWRNVYLGLLPIFSMGLFSCYWVVWAVCIFWKLKPLSIISFTNIFSQFLSCIFIFFMVSFAVEKLVSFIRFHLFVFISLLWETDLRKHWYDLCQRIFCLCSLQEVLWSMVRFIHWKHENPLNRTL